jgi:hypothetical protein
MVHVAATDYSSNRCLASRYPSLLQTTVAMGGFCSSLLCYHCNDIVVATGWLPVATVAYSSLPQCLFVVVITDVLCIPRLKNNIISLGSWMRGGAPCKLRREYSESRITVVVSSSRFTGVRIVCMFCKSMSLVVYVLESGMMEEKMSADKLVMATLATMHYAS